MSYRSYPWRNCFTYPMFTNLLFIGGLPEIGLNVSSVSAGVSSHPVNMVFVGLG